MAGGLSNRRAAGVPRTCRGEPARSARKDADSASVRFEKGPLMVGVDQLLAAEQRRDAEHVERRATHQIAMHERLAARLAHALRRRDRRIHGLLAAEKLLAEQAAIGKRRGAAEADRRARPAVGRGEARES